MDTLKFLYNKFRKLLNHTVGIVSDYIPQYKTSGAALLKYGRRQGM